MSVSAGTAEVEAKRVAATRPVEELDSVVIRFVGDSGDGMQLTGNEFSKAIAKAGHDFATHPDYPSESAPRPAPCSASPATRSSSPRARCSLPATRPTCWWR